MAHTSFPPLMKWCAALERFWGFPVEMNVYLTPPNSQGFTAHYDTHSVFALQVLGSKSWQLYGGKVELPFLDEPFSESNISHVAPRKVVRTIELQESDFLYIPRGHFHSAKASVNPSLHVTVGFFPPTRWNIVSRWIDIVRQDKFFRASSGSYLRPQKSSDSMEQDVMRLRGNWHLIWNLLSRSAVRPLKSSRRSGGY